MPLNKKGQEAAKAQALSILKYSKNVEDAIQAAYKNGMWVLDNSRSRRDWAIADEVERIVRANAQAHFKIG